MLTFLVDVLISVWGAHRINGKKKGVIEFITIQFASLLLAAIISFSEFISVSNGSINSILTASSLLVTLFMGILVLVHGQYEKFRKTIFTIDSGDESPFPKNVSVDSQKEYREDKEHGFKRLFSFVSISTLLSIAVFLISFISSIISEKIIQKVDVLICFMLSYFTICLVFYLMQTLRTLYYMLEDDLNSPII